MGRTPTPIAMISSNTHFTKEKIEAREAAEKALKSDERMVASTEVLADETALKAFTRLKELFSGIDMDDAFYESGLNRYCMMQSDQARMIKERAEIYDAQIDLVDKMALIAKKDAAIAKLRDQMLSFERDNLMTVQAKLKASTQKKADSDDAEDVSGVAAFMQRRAR